MAETFDFEVEFIERELINVTLTTIDTIPTTGESVEQVYNETPTKINDTTFQTNYLYLSGTLIVYFNGIKEKYITEISSNRFTLPIEINSDDDIEVSYVKL